MTVKPHELTVNISDAKNYEDAKAKAKAAAVDFFGDHAGKFGYRVQVQAVLPSIYAGTVTVYYDENKEEQ